MHLATRTELVEPFYVFKVLNQVLELENAGKDIIRLFVGEPDFGTPMAITQRAQLALAKELQGYTPTAGILPLREKIAERYKRWHGLDISPERIIVTPGGSIALQLALLATVNSGEEVLLPEPNYPCYANLMPMLNAIGRSVFLDQQNGLSLNLNDINNAINETTKAILLSSPSNPLGSVMSLNDWQGISELCAANNMHVIADEIYHGLTFEGPAPCVLETNNDAWVVQSFSKFYGMTGWRLGWLVVPDYAIDACNRLGQNLYLSSSAVAQQAALACFDDNVEQECFARVDEFKARRDYLVEQLPALNLPIVAHPDGAFYLYVDISHYSNNALEFCTDILNETGVAMTPGIDFGGPSPSTSVRISYTVSVERLQQAVVRLSAYLKR